MILHEISWDDVIACVNVSSIVSLVCLAINFTLCLAFFCFKSLFSRILIKKGLPICSTDSVLLIIAHPDDEAMFFGPTIIELTEKIKTSVYLISLSTGDFRGEGKERKSELWASCKNLGIKASNITLLNYDLIRDGPSNIWPLEILTRVIKDHVNKHCITHIITFDELGVSGHKNHIDCFRTMTELAKSLEFPKEVRIFVLETVSLARKYSFVIFDLIISYFSCKYLVYNNLDQTRNVIKAMKNHRSQMTWFRHLYLIFSRYIAINTLTELILTSVSKKK